MYGGGKDSKYKSLISFSIFATLGFIIFYISYLGADQVLKKPYLLLIYPFQVLGRTVSEKIDFRISTVRELNETRQELLKTQIELLKYRSTFAEMEILKEENRKLQQLLQLRQNVSFQNLPARIISKDSQNLFSTIIIDKGTADGLTNGLPVIGFTGGTMALVGYILECDEIFARVRTITDPMCQVGVSILGSADTGILRGLAPENNICLIEYIDRKLQSLSGKQVLSSGLGGKYPKGLYIGTISEVIRKNYGLFQEAFLIPHINFFNLESVFILLDDNSVKKSQKK